MSPLAGLRGLDHVGITVPDLEAAVTFYRSLLGAEEAFRLGPFDSRELTEPGGTDWSEAHFNVPDGRFRLVMLTFGDGDRLELFDYERPTQRRTEPPRNHDIGGHHVALRVADLDTAIASARKAGLTVQAGPVAVDDGPAAGMRVIYALDPWGNQLELVERP